MKKIPKASLKDCPPENVFWLSTGATLKNMKELIAALKTMDEGAFSYHVNSEKNDFANWIKDIFNNKELAAKLQGVTHKKKYLELVEKSFK